MLFYPLSLTVKRKSAPGAYVNGRWVEAADSPDIAIRASWQPATGEDVEILPEGKRDKITFKGYTKTKLYAADPETGTSGDIIVAPDGYSYEVLMVGTWQNGIINHYKFMAVRLKEGS